MEKKLYSLSLLCQYDVSRQTFAYRQLHLENNGQEKEKITCLIRKVLHIYPETKRYSLN